MNINLKNFNIGILQRFKYKACGKSQFRLDQNETFTAKKLMKRAIFHFQFGFRKGYSTAQHASEIAGKQYADILYIVVRKYIGFSKVFILSATNIVEETIIIWK